MQENGIDIDRLVRQYGSLVLKQAYFYLKDRHKAEDVCQEVFLRMYKKQPQLPDEQSEKADLVIFLVFLIPGTPKDMLTYVVGMTRVSLKRFLWLSTLARVPSVLSSTLIGSSVIQGEGETALILMLVTGLLGILGIEARE